LFKQFLGLNKMFNDFQRHDGIDRRAQAFKKIRVIDRSDFKAKMRIARTRLRNIIGRNIKADRRIACLGITRRRIAVSAADVHQSRRTFSQELLELPEDRRHKILVGARM